MMKKYLFLFLVILSSVAVHTAAAQINVTLTSPLNSQKFGDCADVPLTVDLDVQSGEVKEVRYYANGFQVGFNRKAPYDDIWEGAPNSIYEVYAKVKDTDGNEYFSETVFIGIGSNLVEHNIVVNGEFTCGLSGWNLQRNEGAAASVAIEELWLSQDDGATITIESGGTATWHIQFQQNFNIKAGHTYTVNFIAEAPESKTIDVAFQQKTDPYTTYFNTTVIVQDADIYGPFVFEAAEDQPAAQFKFNVGNNLIPISIDGVEIIDETVSGVKQTHYLAAGVAESFLMSQNYPNPFNPETTIHYDISDAGQVNVTVFDIQGRQIVTLVNETKTAGSHDVVWNGRDSQGQAMPSGMYVYRINAVLNDKTHQFSRKIMLIE